MRNPVGAPVEITVGDEAAAWRSVGFTVGEGGECRVGAVRVRLVGAGTEAGRGILGWTLAGAPEKRLDVDGLLTTVADAADGLATSPDQPSEHPNGAIQIDHLVVITPDLDRTTAALAVLGVEARRTREAGRGLRQRFFRFGEVILEVVGPVEPAGTGPAKFWGFAFTVADIDATADLLEGRVGEPKEAVQPGRRIATVRSGDELSVPIAFMSAADASRPRGDA